ncbi:acyl carrier protein, partial [Streptomyces hoynatensis]
DLTFLTVTHTDWSRFAPSFTAERPSPLLTGIPEVREALAEPEQDAETAGGEAEFVQRLAAMPEAERSRAMLDMVRTEAARTLGFESVADLPAGRAFREVGFDSVMAVELRNRLRTTTGLPLPAALVFDYPTPAAIATYLQAELFADAPATEENDPDAEIRAALAAIPISRLRKAGLLDMVLQLANGDAEPAPAPAASGEELSLDEMDAEALLRLATDETTNGD